MPLSLKNAPASFQEYINKIFAEKFNIFVIVYLDNILIYTDDDGDGHVAAVQWVLEQLSKFSLFANLKKCQFHQKEVRFLGYVMFLKSICMGNKRIEAVKQWLELQSVREIQVFLRFANFYWRFIQRFNWIAAPLILILKTLEGIESKTKPGEGRVGVGDDSRVRHGRSEIGGSGIDDVKVDGGEVKVDKVGKKIQNLSKSKKTVRSSDFPTSNAKLAFIELRQAFLKAPILHHFDPKRHTGLRRMY